VQLLIRSRNSSGRFVRSLVMDLVECRSLKFFDSLINSGTSVDLFSANGLYSVAFCSVFCMFLCLPITFYLYFICIISELTAHCAK